MADAQTVENAFNAVDNMPDGPAADARSSSPANQLDDPQANKDDANKDKDKEVKKPRKKLPRLDEGRLVGDNGFPQLIHDTKHFRVKGKGHEASDLNRLLNVYQFWTHKLYPKTPFKETVERVEKLCHSKRMQNMLSQWRDEAHGKPPPEPDADEDDVPEDVQNQQQSDADAAPARSSVAITDDEEQFMREFHDDPESDPPVASSSRNHLGDEDEEMAMREFHTDQEEDAPPVASLSKRPAEDEYDDIEIDSEVLGAFEQTEHASSDAGYSDGPPPTEDVSMDGHDDEWDYIT
uniref:Chromosome segregation in meiosis protein n=1 Tax=Mycena chlorophos TaxID=658473 RepID=A0ABQ0LQ40_MYCCL|nr:predicted protein [Mycena chlorophos]